jgi:RNA polymerase sigma-70 factor (ECF subfamily)
VETQDAQLHDLFARYAQPLQRFCMRELGNVQEAEDAVQTTFLNAFRAFRRGVRPDLEAAWLYAIAANVCRSRRRSFFRRRRVESDDDLHALAEVIAAPQGHEAETLMGLGDALADLPENQRNALLLREWQGLSYAEIAKEMGLSHSAVETLIFRGRRNLAKGLEEKDGRRLVGGLNVGSLLTALKGLLGGAGAAKLALGGAAVIATAVAVPALHHGTPAPAPARPAAHHQVPVTYSAPVVAPTTAHVPVKAATHAKKHATPKKTHAPKLNGLKHLQPAAALHSKSKPVTASHGGTTLSHGAQKPKTHLTQSSVPKANLKSPSHAAKPKAPKLTGVAKPSTGSLHGSPSPKPNPGHEDHGAKQR